jgi:hypothetical protein
MALETCAQFGLPPSVIQRAAYLSRCFKSSLEFGLLSTGANVPLTDNQDSNAVYELAPIATALRLILENTRIDFASDEVITFVTESQDPPSSLEGSCCLYVLLILPVSSILFKHFIRQLISYEYSYSHRNPTGWSACTSAKLKALIIG